MCISGVFSEGTIKTQNIDPNLVLNYVSCHDNYTLYDQLIQTMNEDRLFGAYTQADAIVFLAQGVPFIQEGEEFMRSKLDETTGKYSGNSYNVGDFINVMDYSLKIEHRDVFEKTKELIAFRRSTAEFRLGTRQEGLAVLTRSKDLHPQIEVSERDCTFLGDKTIVLETKNCEESWYYFNGEASNKHVFTDRAEVALADNVKDGKVDLTVVVRSGKNTFEQTFTYSRAELMEGGFNLINLHRQQLERQRQRAV